MSRKQDREKFIQEIGTETDTLTATKPFKLEQDERRRYVRLEISSPMALRKIRDIGGQFWPQGERRVIDGLILNISGSGVLVEINQPVNEGDVVVMQFTLQDVERLEHVLGLVKRADYDDEGYLVGIEFVTREDLADLFPQDQLALLAQDMTGFGESIRRVVNRYVRREQTADGNGHESR